MLVLNLWLSYINHSKSKILNISVPQGQVQPLQDSFPYHWEFMCLHYLGTNLTSSPIKLCPPLFNKLKSVLERETSPPPPAWAELQTLKLHRCQNICICFGCYSLGFHSLYYRTYNDRSSNLFGTTTDHGKLNGPFIIDSQRRSPLSAKVLPSHSISFSYQILYHTITEMDIFRGSQW